MKKLTVRLSTPVTPMPATHHQKGACAIRPKPSVPTAAASCPVESVTCRTSIGRPKKAPTTGTMPSIRPSEMFEAKPEMLARQ